MASCLFCNHKIPDDGSKFCDKVCEYDYNKEYTQTESDYDEDEDEL